MNIYTYDFELQTMTTMLMNCFSDIVIKRFNVNKDPRDQIKTRVVYAPKQRVLNDLLDKDQNIQLPVISVQIGGVARDANRTFNKIVGSFYTPANSTASANEKGPLPIDVTYNVSILTRYQQDMDQILSHLIPYINPYFVVSWRTPQRPDHEIRSVVEWNGSVNIQYPVELGATQVAKVQADLTFTFKGWMFQHLQRYENIFTVETNYIPDIYDYELTTREEVHAVSLSAIYYGAPPKPSVIYPEFANAEGYDQISIWGTGIKGVRNVYLSGAVLSPTTHNPFALYPKLSGSYPAFTGIKLLSTTWTTNNDDLVTFIVPSAVKLGYVDVILENPGGYGSLIKNIKKNTYNPHKIGTIEYNQYIPPQVPYLSGLKIVAN